MASQGTVTQVSPVLQVQLDSSVTSANAKRVDSYLGAGIGDRVLVDVQSTQLVVIGRIL